MPLVQPIVWIAPQTPPALEEQILRHVQNAEEFAESLGTSSWQGRTQQVPPELQIEEGELWAPSRIDTWESFLQDNLPVPVELVIKTEKQSRDCGCKLDSEASEEGDTAAEHSPACMCACAFCNKQRACACSIGSCECPVLCNCVCKKCTHVVVCPLSLPMLEIWVLTSLLEPRRFAVSTGAISRCWPCTPQQPSSSPDAQCHGVRHSLRRSACAPQQPSSPKTQCRGFRDSLRRRSSLRSSACSEKTGAYSTSPSAACREGVCRRFRRRSIRSADDPDNSVRAQAGSATHGSIANFRGSDAVCIHSLL
jgi:hypothetical protein